MDHQAIVHRSCTKLRSANLDKVVIRLNIKSDLQEMMEVFEAILPVLEDVERLSAREKAVQLWLRRVRRVAHDIFDMVDELLDQRMPAVGTITRMKEELMEIRYQFRYLASMASLASVQRNVPETADVVAEEMTVIEDKRRILAALSLNSIREGPIILPIFGLGCMGETKLAKMVFDDIQFREYNFRIWVHVSQEFDLQKIGESMIYEISRTKINGSNAISQLTEDCQGLDQISRASGDETNGLYGISQVLEEQGHTLHEISQVSEEVIHGSNEISEVLEEEVHGSTGITKVSEEEIHGSNETPQVPAEERHDSNGMDRTKERLHQLCNGMKVLVVLDDLWEEDSIQLEHLKCLFSVGNKMIVIVTTRSEAIARKICTVKPYKLNPLSDDMCWTIIKEMSNFEDRSESEKQELEHIGRELATKCGGLPIAAQELGRRLGNKDVGGWKREIDICIHNDNAPFAIILQSLELSYRSMPPSLRLCFSYCAIFPKGHNIAKDDLIHQWIALLLIEPSNGLSHIQLAEEYIRRLLDISFLQIAKSASTSSKGEILLTMHEQTHAFARSVIGDELIVLDGRMGTSRQIEYCHYALLTGFDVRLLKLSSILPAKLWALHCVGYSKTEHERELSDDVFSFARCLRVLELMESPIKKLPHSICQLRHLGYLNLSGCSGLVNLPESIGDLVNLVHIDLSGCTRLENLPGSFGNLTNLAHLNLSGSYRLSKLPDSFQKLQSLIHLDLSGWSCFEGIPVFGGLTNLQRLNLSHPCRYIAEHLSHLKGLPGVLGKLTKLQYLNLSMCLNPTLYYLSEKESIEYIRSCIKGLSSLQHLDLSQNIFLRGLPGSLDDLKKLHTLDLSGCIRLKRIAKGIREMKSLKFIVVTNCRGLESYPFVVRTDEGGYSSNLFQLEDVNCGELEISCLEEVKSTEEVQRIRLAHKGKLKKLKLCWTVGSQRSVEDNALLEALKPPNDLQCLELHSYNGDRCLPSWWTSSILLNLVEVTMEDIGKCRSLPPLGLLPNLQRVVLRRMASITRIHAGDLSGGNSAAFNKLSKITLDDMEALEEFNNGGQEFHTTCCNSGDEFMDCLEEFNSGSEGLMFPDIDELEIRKCPSLSFEPLLPRARRLVISDCDQVLYSWRHREGHGVKGPSTSAASVTELVVKRCKAPLCDWSLLHHLPGLHTLHVENCDNLSTCSPEIIRVLSSLRSLCFSHCDSMTSLPEGLGDLGSLLEIAIYGCRGVVSLPESIDKLTNLQGLYIWDCPELKKWCQSEANKKKLARIAPKYEKYGTSKQAKQPPQRQISVQPIH